MDFNFMYMKIQDQFSGYLLHTLKSKIYRMFYRLKKEKKKKTKMVC